MKSFLGALAAVSSVLTLGRAQQITTEWTWLGGRDDAVMVRDGLKPTPGFRRDAMMAVDEQSDTLFLFGGILTEFMAPGTPSITNRMSDLWQYSYASGAWRFVDGTAFNYYSSGSTARPGPCRNGGTFYHRRTRSLYLFGGQVVSENVGDIVVDQLWRYSFIENRWHFLTGTTDTKLFPVSATWSYPGSLRLFAHAYDNTTETWYVFGGRVTNSLYSNALWKYEVIRGKWTRLNGNAGQNTAGIYSGDQPISPGSRHQASLVYDDRRQRIWLFGGYGFGDTAQLPGELNDLWFFELSAGKWIYLTGSMKAKDAWIASNLQNSTELVARAGAAAFCGVQCNELFIFGGTARVKASRSMIEGTLYYIITLSDLVQLCSVVE